MSSLSKTPLRHNIVAYWLLITCVTPVNEAVNAAYSEEPSAWKETMSNQQLQ